MIKQSKLCQKAEAFLLKQMVEGLSGTEEKQLKNHLEICSSCQNFASALVAINDAVNSNDKSHIKPRPETLIRLKEKLNVAYVVGEKQKKGQTFAGKPHLYPAVAAVIIAVMLVFSVNTVIPVSEVSPIDTTYNQIIQLTQPAVVDLNSINQQTGGKSLREDSLLLNYIYSGL